MDHSPAGPGSAAGDGCRTGCAATGNLSAGTLRSYPPWSSIAAPVARRHAALTGGIDGGRKIRGIKIPAASDKNGILLAIDVSPANRHDTKGIAPLLRTLADGTFKGPALVISATAASAGEAFGITVRKIPGGRDGRFVPAGVGWLVKHSFRWLTC